jgi:hypothetical protein
MTALILISSATCAAVWGWVLGDVLGWWRR